MMARPPTSSGQPNDGHMASINSQSRPLTGPADRPPLHNPHQHSLATPGSGFNLAQDGASEHMPDLYNQRTGSMGSQHDGNQGIQPSNFNF